MQPAEYLITLKLSQTRLLGKQHETTHRTLPEFSNHSPIHWEIIEKYTPPQKKNI